MSSNTKIYSNLRIIDHNTNLPIKKTIYVEDGLISKISEEVLFQGEFEEHSCQSDKSRGITSSQFGKKVE